MEIVIFGGLHDGLTYYDRFQTELKREMHERGSDPKFVAVEWREEVYRALTAEQDWLKGRLRERWPEAHEEVIRLAGESLCWEADAHLDACGRKLERGREVGGGRYVVGAAHGTRFDRYSLPCQLDERGIHSTSKYIIKPPWADEDHCGRDRAGWASSQVIRRQLSLMAGSRVPPRSI